MTSIDDGWHRTTEVSISLKTLCEPLMSCGQDSEAVAVSVDGHIEDIPLQAFQNILGATCHSCPSVDAVDRAVALCSEALEVLCCVYGTSSCCLTDSLAV